MPSSLSITFATVVTLTLIVSLSDLIKRKVNPIIPQVLSILALISVAYTEMRQESQYENGKQALLQIAKEKYTKDHPNKFPTTEEFTLYIQSISYKEMQKSLK